jgi:4-diphosphocytidyl-2-C-methyl-D-erythritol kinase
VTELAAGIGSDAPFFLQNFPALANGRGERVEPLEIEFTALKGMYFILVHPGFGVSTAWAYRELARHPDALAGTPGRAGRLIDKLQGGDLAGAAIDFYNALEAPVLRKFPILTLFQEFLRERGAAVALMSGSGSTTFGLFPGEAEARAVEGAIRAEFGAKTWTSVVPARGGFEGS